MASYRGVNVSSALKASHEFTRLVPSIVVVTGYGVAFYLLSLVLRSIPVGIAYAVWSGLGIVLVSIVGAVIYREYPDLPAVVGITLIVSGIVVIFTMSATHGR